MTFRGILFVVLAAASLFAGLGTGYLIYTYLGALLLLLFICGLITVILFRFSISCQVFIQSRKILRGENGTIIVRAKYSFPVLISRIQLNVVFAGEDYVSPMDLSVFHDRQLSVFMPAPHIGTFPFGVKSISAEDPFGLFHVDKTIKGLASLAVLPRPFDIEKLSLREGEEGHAYLSRAQEDYTSPEDVRQWQPGDAMKRVHWKLSARKREIMVRRYEAPAPPDTLILLDNGELYISDPDRRNEAFVRDALLETTLAAAKMQLKASSPVRVPFYGSQAGEYYSMVEDQTTSLEEKLAMQSFDDGQPFEKKLLMEIRRNRHLGAFIVIATNLTPGAIELIASLRRMGPNARVYLVDYPTTRVGFAEIARKLEESFVEVCYVTPIS